MKVLLVEDDETLRDAYRLVLEVRDVELTTARSGEEAIAAAAADAFEAIVVDLGVPGTSGSELVGELRSLASGTPLLVLTGREETGLRRACLDAGADGYYVKPLSAGEMLEAIEEASTGR